MRQYCQKCTLFFGLGYAINLLCLSRYEITLIQEVTSGKEIWHSRKESGSYGGIMAQRVRIADHAEGLWRRE